METYKITRFYASDSKNRNRVIASGLTLEEAQAHCRDPESSSRTAKSAIARKLTEMCGAWFDGYAKEDSE